MKMAHFENMSVEEMISEAIDRELSLLAYYKVAAASSGNDVAAFFTNCCSEQECRITELEALLLETEEMREITQSMAD